MKLADYPKLEEFLSNEIIAAIAVPIDESGTIHAAVLHYWHNPEPLQFYFVTAKESEKCTLLREGKTVKAACIVGTTHGVPFAIQMRGELKMVKPEEHKKAAAAYRQKRRSRNDDLADAKNALLEFTPNWARFTDYALGSDHHFLDLP